MGVVFTPSVSEVGQLSFAVAVDEQRRPDRERTRVVRIEHNYPQAQSFLVAHGHQGVAVLQALLQDAAVENDVLVASGSSRSLAARTELLSKDTVHRHLLKLQRAGVLTFPDPH
jgi:hypothetical protein